MRDPFTQQGASDSTMAHSPSCQAVILAGGGGSRLYPLNASGLPKVLLPVANRPLLTFPLRTLEEAGITDVLVVSLRSGQPRAGAPPALDPTTPPPHGRARRSARATALRRPCAPGSRASN